MWTDEDLEEMGRIEPFDRAMFLSGCEEHRLCNGHIEGFIVSEEKLKKLVVLYHEMCYTDSMKGR